MLRFVVILLASVLLISLLRSIIGIIMHGFAEMLKSSSTPSATPRRPEVPVAGELKKDPVCGTFVSTATALKTTSGAETVYFCSAQCRDRYRG
jgi:YHS domain-containing protein